MRVLVQRVSSASVSVDETVVASIDHGLVVLVAVEADDTESDAISAASKVCALRIFSDPNGKMNLSIGDVGGSILAVSQFTLAADVKHGRRPSFVGAAGPEVAVPIFDRFVDECREVGVPTSTGRFGAHMDVALVNHGPVTIFVETNSGRVV